MSIFRKNMEKEVSQLRWMSEILWFVGTIIVTLTFTWSLYPLIERFYFFYIVMAMFLALNYLRWILFPDQSPLMQSFWFKLVVVFFNIPIFLLTIKFFMSILDMFDSFDFSEGLMEGRLIADGAELDFIQYVRDLTIASVSALVVLIVLFLFRTVHLIFKWRQLPDNFLK